MCARQNWDRQEANTLFYALSVRLHQCLMILGYRNVIGDYYSWSSTHDELNRSLIEIHSAEVFLRWKSRPMALAERLRCLIEAVASTATVQQYLQPLMECAAQVKDRYVDVPDFAERWITPDDHTSRPHKAVPVFRELCQTAANYLLQLAQVFGNEQDAQEVTSWVQLGKEIVNFDPFADQGDAWYGDRNEYVNLQESDNDVEELTWCGFDTVRFSTLVRAKPKWERSEAITSILNELDIDRNELCPSLDESDAHQQEIVELEFIPTAYSGWFSLEAGLWRLLYGRTRYNPRAERDALFLRWKQESTSKQPNKFVREKWNGLPEEERKKISPESFEPIQLEAVRDALKRAAQNQKVHQYYLAQKIF